MDRPSSETRNLQQQIAFARHNFDNLQSLIRFSDTKAAAIVTIAIFLAASGLQVAKEAVPYANWHSCRHSLLSSLLVFSGLVFWTAFGRIVWTVQHVLRPRGARYYPSPNTGVDLMWQDHILAHSTHDAYASAVEAAADERILKNTTDQVFELASISKNKMDALIGARSAIWCAFLSWSVAVILSLLLVRWK